MRRTARRGYTLIEAAVTLFLLSIITVTSVFMIGASSSTGSDAVAQASADAAMDAVVAVLSQDGSLPNDPVARLTIQQPDVSFVSSSTVSSSSSIASIAVSQGVAAVAVSGSSGACWMLRLDINSGDSNHIRRYVLVPEGSSRTCTAAAALGTDVLNSSSSRGSSWGRPLVWSDSSSSVLSNALIYLRSDSVSQDSQRVRNEGSGGPSLDAVFGTSTTQDAQDPLFLGHSGQDYLYVPGAGNYASTPDSAWLDLSGDLSLSAHVKPTDWTPSTPQGLISKFSPVSGSMSYALVMLSDGRLSLRWSASSNTSSLIEVSSSSATPFKDGQSGWIRAKLDATGSSTSTTFWVSSDGSSWSQLGSTTTTPSSAPITVSSEPLVVGALSDGSLPYAGSVFLSEVRSIQGALVAQFDPSSCNANAQSCSGATGEEWSVSRASGGMRATVVSRDALLFGDSVLSIPDATAIDMSQSGYLTVIARLRVFDDTPGSLLFGKQVDTDPDAKGYGVRLGSGTVVGFATDGSLTTQTSATVNYGEYTTVVLRVEPVLSRVQMWIDEVSSLSSSGLTSPWPDLGNPHFFTVGGARSSSGVSGNASMELYSLAVFDRSLTQEEINRASSELSR